jgi:hypothetical protein
MIKTVALVFLIMFGPVAMISVLFLLPHGNGLDYLIFLFFVLELIGDWGEPTIASDVWHEMARARINVTKYFFPIFWEIFSLYFQ